MSTPPKQKQCARCRFYKPMTSYPVAESLPDGRSTTCYRCKKGKGPRVPLESEEPPKRFVRTLDSQRYIITAAQNATPIEPAFFDALERAAKKLDAELVVIPLRYKNPTSIFSQNQQRDDWWDTRTVKYLFNQRKKLNPNLVLVGDVKTQPTASSPLTGFESLTGAESCIIGHPKMQFKTVPVPSGRFPKVLSTTGVCTKPNYTDTKSGKIGAFHHYLGALLIEIRGKTFHMRQLNADRADGSFIDLDTKYTAKGSEKAPPALALIMGDTHCRFIDKAVDKATFGPEGIVETLNPETLVFHDVIDGYATNPHHEGNPFIAAAKSASGIGDVREEIQHCVDFLRERTKGRKGVVVSSNHDNFLSRWVMRHDWKRDPKNADFYLDTAKAMLKSARIGPGGAEYMDPFIHWVNALKGDADLRCLELDESFKIAGIECGMHGHLGPNGARGTLQAMARVGDKSITGHSHTPGIEEGAYAVGTSTPRRLEYNTGPSSWLNTHCVLYANGRRALITIVDGEYRI